MIGAAGEGALACRSVALACYSVALACCSVRLVVVWLVAGHVLTTSIQLTYGEMDSNDKKKQGSGSGRGGGTRGGVSAAVLKDQRFAHVYSDPRFKASHPVSVSIPLSTFLSVYLSLSVPAYLCLPVYCEYMDMSVWPDPAS